MNAHPLAQLARTHLSGSTRIRHVPAVPADLFHEAVARYGAGIDHLAGEMPLALLTVNLNAQAQRARDYSANYIVTDRRLFGRAEAGSIPRHFVDVPYAYVTGAPSKPSAMALLTRGRADLEARVASLIGPTNLAMFYPSV